MNKLKQEEIILNDFELINEKKFVQYASISHMYKVDKFEARLLNTKYNISIFWCSFKKDGEEFNAYLADLGYGENQHMIYSKIYSSVYNIFKELKQTL